MFAVILFYILTIIGIFILRKKMPDAERPYKAFGYPIMQIIYIILASLFCINLIYAKPVFGIGSLSIVVLGIPVYYIWKAMKKTPTT
jgi:APA family basic amino acid/polyamine antiporter